MLKINYYTIETDLEEEICPSNSQSVLSVDETKSFSIPRIEAEVNLLEQDASSEIEPKGTDSWSV